mmetsp:Transcript_93831/g.270342  ORF Transcript_93831/g.270342 Transcript_93831/m.270342 type:complete len:421 (+) Transcript_93831:206-1468(+)
MQPVAAAAASRASDHSLQRRQPLLQLAHLGVLPHLLLAELLLVAKPVLVRLELVPQLLHLVAQGAELLALLALLLLVAVVVLAQLREAGEAHHHTLVSVLLMLGEAFCAELGFQLGDLLQQLLDLFGRRRLEARSALVVLRDLRHEAPLPLPELLRLTLHVVACGLLRRQEGPGEGVQPGFEELQVPLRLDIFAAIPVFFLQLLPVADHLLRQALELVDVAGALQVRPQRLGQLRLEPRRAAAQAEELLVRGPRRPGPGRRGRAPRSRLLVPVALLQTLQRRLRLGSHARRLLGRQPHRGRVIVVLGVRRPHAPALRGSLGAKVAVLRRQPSHHEAGVNVALLRSQLADQPALGRALLVVIPADERIGLRLQLGDLALDVRFALGRRVGAEQPAHHGKGGLHRAGSVSVEVGRVRDCELK